MPTSDLCGPLVKETVFGSDVFTCFNAIVILYHFPATKHKFVKTVILSTVNIFRQLELVTILHLTVAASVSLF